MGKIIILGTACAVSDAEHKNTHLVIQEGQQTILVDCPESPIPILGKVGLKPEDFTDLVVTHFHPDHTAGIPLFLMDLWLLGRTRPLYVYGLSETLDKVEKVMQLYDWRKWPKFFPVIFNRLPTEEMLMIIETPELRLWVTPVKHLIPTIGVRADFKLQEKSAAYSCDTEPVEAVTRLAENVDILIHEATGAITGHSTPAGAAIIGRRARAKQLCLIHYCVRGAEAEKMVREASEIFPGKVFLAEDNMSLEF
jgi:ribonuclease Z